MSRKNFKYVVFYLFYILYFYFLVATFQNVENKWWIVLFIPLAFYFADFMGGLVHLVSDYYPCRENTGLKELFFYEGNRSSKEYQQLKKQTMKKVSSIEEVMFDFKVHHPRPLAMARRSGIQLLLSGVLYLGGPVIICLIILIYLGINPELQSFLLITIFAMTLSQFSHTCAHRHSNNIIVKFLQRTKIFISPEIHDHHHVVLDKDFAVLNGWSNPLVNVIANYCFKRGLLDSDGLIPK